MVSINSGHIPRVKFSLLSCSIISMPTKRSVPLATAPISALTVNGRFRMNSLMLTFLHSIAQPPVTTILLFFLESGSRPKVWRSFLEMAVPALFPESNLTAPGTIMIFPSASSIFTGSSSMEIT